MTTWTQEGLDKGYSCTERVNIIKMLLFSTLIYKSQYMFLVKESDKLKLHFKRKHK